MTVENAVNDSRSLSSPTSNSPDDMLCWAVDETSKQRFPLNCVQNVLYIVLSNSILHEYATCILKSPGLPSLSVSVRPVCLLLFCSDSIVEVGVVLRGEGWNAWMHTRLRPQPAEVEMRESLKKEESERAYDTHCQLTFRGLIEIKMQWMVNNSIETASAVVGERVWVGCMQLYVNCKFLSTNDYTGWAERELCANE